MHKYIPVNTQQYFFPLCVNAFAFNNVYVFHKAKLFVHV